MVTGATRRASLTPGSPHQLFPFCQLDFSFPLGPADGRYLARRADDDPAEVLVFRSLEAPRPTLRRGRRPKKADPTAGEPALVPMSRVTVIGTAGFEDDADANRWLERCRSHEGERAQATESAVKALNRVIQAQRVCAHDPYLREVDARQALTIRIGYGPGDDVVEGRWRAAYTIAPPSPRGGRRRQMLSPHDEVSAILSGRATIGAGHDLVLRARLDLEQDRTRQAALQLKVAIDALQAELASDERADATREAAANVRDLHGRAINLAQSALGGDLDELQTAALAQLLEDAERALRRRRRARD